MFPFDDVIMDCRETCPIVVLVFHWIIFSFITSTESRLSTSRDKFVLCVFRTNSYTNRHDPEANAILALSACLWNAPVHIFVRIKVFVHIQNLTSNCYIQHFGSIGRKIRYVNNLTVCIQKSMLQWWRHQMEIFSVLLVLCAGNLSATGEFPSQMPVTRSGDVFFDLRLNNRLSKQSMETPVIWDANALIVTSP